jgi:PIN domain nuclease of toxin-antitoxin system
VNLLLDTHLLLWAADYGEDAHTDLPARAVSLIRDEANSLYFSAASIWEVAIKRALDRSDFDVDPHALRRGLAANGYIELPVTSRHGASVAGLPPIHKDPFDRLLIAQAIVEGVTLLTADAKVAAYPGPIERV